MMHTWLSACHALLFPFSNFLCASRINFLSSRKNERHRGADLRESRPIFKIWYSDKYFTVRCDRHASLEILTSVACFPLIPRRYPQNQQSSEMLETGPLSLCGWWQRHWARAESPLFHEAVFSQLLIFKKCFFANKEQRYFSSKNMMASQSTWKSKLFCCRPLVAKKRLVWSSEGTPSYSYTRARTGNFHVQSPSAPKTPHE